MFLVYIGCFFLLGLVFGSFFGVVGMRLPIGEKIIWDHSRCDSCTQRLKAMDMIPLFSYIRQKGKCRYCGAHIPLLLPMIELCTGLLFAVSYYSFGFSWDLVLALLLVSLFMIVLVSDLLYFIIPDSILIFFSISIIIVQYFRIGIYDTFIHLLTGGFLFVLMYSIMCLGNHLFKKESLGGGDIKMLFLFGLVLDPLLGTLSIFLGSFIALPISLVIYHFCRENIIPFGPFLLLALLIIFYSKVTPHDILTFLGI